MEQINYYQSVLDKELSQYQIFKTVEQKTKIPKVYAFLAFSILMLALILFNCGAALIVNVLSFVYPAYASLQAIEIKNDQDSFIQWTTYWIIFASFNVLEYFSSILLEWFPFFYIFKMVLMVYLYLPKTKGAVVVYTTLIRPIFLNQIKKD